MQLVKNQLIESILQSHERQLQIIAQKNHDYSPGADNYSNFRSVNYIMPWISVEEGILIRMLDKLQRAANLVHFQETYVTDEKLEDTLDDIANYSNLILAFRANEITETEIYAEIQRIEK